MWVNRQIGQRIGDAGMAREQVTRDRRNGPKNRGRTRKNPDPAQCDGKHLPGCGDMSESGAQPVLRRIVGVDREGDMRRVAKIVAIRVEAPCRENPPQVLDAIGAGWIKAQGDGERHRVRLRDGPYGAYRWMED